ncbi:MAG: hypothetical protein OXG95_04580 [Chloroflexi bacterium]|nr:hypothetical protein [Chloroflexota bacterium]
MTPARLELFVNEHDISPYIGEQVHVAESMFDWTVHAELVRNPTTQAVLQPLNDKSVSVRYRIRAGEVARDWHRGNAVVNWRQVEDGTEELILDGAGRVRRESPSTPRDRPAGPVTATATFATQHGGRVLETEEKVVTIVRIEEDPQVRAAREAQRLRNRETHIRSLTSPSFVLFLARSSLSSYRLLYNTGTSHSKGELLYSAFIFLPLTIEYFIKYLLIRGPAGFKNDYKNHRLLRLFDFLPFDIQRAIDEEFQSELKKIGHSSRNLRVFLRKSQNAFTAVRYLFDPRYAERSSHLLEPENTAVLECVANALERVSTSQSEPVPLEVDD